LHLDGITIIQGYPETFAGDVNIYYSPMNRSSGTGLGTGIPCEAE
jgi:hypothetical protein